MKRRIGLTIGVQLAVLALVGGCGGDKVFSARMDHNDASGSSQAMIKSAETNSVPAPAAPQDSKSDDSPKLTLAKFQTSDPDRYLIKTAVITLESADVRGEAGKLSALALRVQGYVSDSHEAVDGLGSRSVTMTVRVPYQQFDSAAQQIEALGKVLEKQVSAQDVTEEFVDTTSRVRNLKKSEERLLVHLSHTGKLSDTLAIENELTRVREEVEKSEGRLRFLAHRVSYSTFTVTFKETARAQSVTPPESFSSGKIATDAGRSLVGFLQGLWSNIIWLGIWAIVWLPPVALVAWFLRREIRRHRRPSSPPPIPHFDIPKP